MKRKGTKKPETSPVRHLQLELRELRRELRTTARVYAIDSRGARNTKCAQFLLVPEAAAARRRK